MRTKASLPYSQSEEHDGHLDAFDGDRQTSVRDDYRLYDMRNLSRISPNVFPVGGWRGVLPIRGGLHGSDGEGQQEHCDRNRVS